MADRIYDRTPKQDGYRMPAEYERQKQIWMCWPERTDVWRDGARPAQQAYVEVAKAIRRFEPVTMLVNARQYDHARATLPPEIRVVEMSMNDAWARDTGPVFLINDAGELRACDFEFNAWGGLTDGLFFPWDLDDRLARKICELEMIDSYRTDGFVLEGGSFHVDGEGTVLTTEMCLLSKGRNPQLTKEQIECKLRVYLNAEKVIWLKDGIDPEETNGHIDDVACFVRPGEVVCLNEENPNSPFYQASQNALHQLSQEKDAKGRSLKVHRLCCPKEPIRLPQDYVIDNTETAKKRSTSDICIASYVNFLIVNGGLIVPQYDDENDALAIKQLQEVFPDRQVVGVHTREIVYGGGNIHCITQQQPEGISKENKERGKNYDE